MYGSKVVKIRMTKPFISCLLRIRMQRLKRILDKKMGTEPRDFGKWINPKVSSIMSISATLSVDSPLLINLGSITECLNAYSILQHTRD